MALNAGTKLDPYEILAPLGAGGMGEVYRARDTRLDRDVAIKVLPEALARDKERIQRFGREAKVLASLNHPNIASIYGFEEFEGKRLLVMELAEGETLAERIARGPLPVRDSLEFAVGIALALEAAHEKGVIHRDLKPANVKVTPDGIVKVLDFGLAKAMVGDATGTDIANSPTITAEHTRPGVVLGTAAYMSPEQARGRPLDKRTDIWSFGALLYECLTGRRPFLGETTSDLVAKILEREPDWSALPPGTPPLVQLLLRRCLAKDRDKRLRDIGDARVEIENAIADPTSSSLRWATTAVAEEDAPHRRRPGSLILAWGLCLLMAISIVWLWTTRGKEMVPEDRRVVRLSVPAPKTSPRYRNLVISPDGKFLVHRPDGSDRDTRLRVRALNDFNERILENTDGAFSPFISWTSDAVAFFTETELRVVPVFGGSPQKVCDAIGFTTGVWGPDGTIIFSTVRRGDGGQPGLSLVNASGGAVEILTSVDPAKGERVHGHPSFLPDGEHVLFTIQGATGSKVAVLSLKTREQRVVLQNASQPMFVPPGILLYFDPDRVRLFAVPFDLNTLHASDRRTEALGETLMAYSLSMNGTLAYVPDRDEQGNTVIWIDRDGKSTPLVDRVGSWVEPRLSPDGTKVLLRQTNSPDCYLWVYEIERKILTRLTFEEDSHGPQWSGDGRSALVGIEGAQARSLFRVSIDGEFVPERLWGSNGPVFAGRGPADGSKIVMTEEISPNNRDLWVVTFGDEVKGEPFLQTPFNEGWPAFSPDGKWIVYTSDESGRDEVYLRAYPGRGNKTQISTEGGTDPLWSRDGKELFYFHRQDLMAVEIATEPALSMKEPRKLIGGDYLGSRQSNYDVSVDGQRFLTIKSADTQGTVREMRVILNWTEELAAKLRTK